MSNPAFIDDDGRSGGPSQEAASKHAEASGAAMTSSADGAVDDSPPPKYDASEQHAVNISHESLIADKPYSGMNKEDLLRFSDTPFWNNLRLACFVIFWLGWAALLGAVIGLTVTADRCDQAPAVQWWQSTPFYQIYVRSFYDSDGDGVGDLRGIREKMSYLSDIRVQGIILSSFYESSSLLDVTSQPDFGYEVTNHTAIDPIYGDIQDFIELLETAHENDIKVIIDFIPNHTGTGHPWFAGLLTGDAAYAGYYVTADCTPGDPINNWKNIYNQEGPLSVFGVSAWSELNGSGTCYLHQGLYTQPDLNLRNQRVRTELDEILRYWLSVGVDGVRVNGARHLVEDYELNEEALLADTGDGACDVDGVDTPYECYDHAMTASQQENFALMSHWRAIVDEYSTSDAPRVLLADAKETVENTLLYYGQVDGGGANLALNYDLLTTVQQDCNGLCMGQLVDAWLNSKEEFVTDNWMTGHQDEPRVTSQNSEALLVLKLTLPGSSVLYYGEEIGMSNIATTPDTCRDPGGDNRTMQSYCRDAARSPMQWSGEDNAGFSTNDTWLPVNDDYVTKNVETLWDSGDEFNILKVYAKMADIQRTETAFNYGVYESVIVDEEIFSFMRHYDGTDRYLVTMNLGSSESRHNYASHSGVPDSAACVVTNTGHWSADDSVSLTGLTLAPGEYVVVTWPYSR